MRVQKFRSSTNERIGKKGDGHTDGWTYGQSDQRLVRELLYATKIMKI